MATQVYRAGVIGLGVMGNIADALGGRHPAWFRPCCHADAYVCHPRTELVAGSTRDPNRQALFVEKRGSLPVYGDFREMLDRESLDFVSIAAPATCHAEMVIAAAQVGVKAIYCEKAMAGSLGECDAMIAACEATGTVLAINHLRRWDDRFRSLTSMLEGGAIGRLQCIQISFGGGRLCRGGSHMFDLALMYCGEDEVAQGCGWLSNPDSFDPGGIGLFETRNGVRITIDGSIGMAHGFQADLVGEKGVVRIIDGGFEFELWTKDESTEFGHLARRHLPMNYPVGNPMLSAIDDLIKEVEQGIPSRSSGTAGRQAFEMITAIHLSHREGRRFVAFPLEERELKIPSN